MPHQRSHQPPDHHRFAPVLSPDGEPATFPARQRPIVPPLQVEYVADTARLRRVWPRGRMSVRGAGGRSTVRRVSRRRAAFHHPVSPKERAPRLRKPGGAAVEQNLGILKSEPAKAIVLLLIEYRVKSDRHLSCERHDLDISHVRTVTRSSDRADHRAGAPCTARPTRRQLCARCRRRQGGMSQ